MAAVTERAARRLVAEVMTEQPVEYLACAAQQATDYLPNRLFAKAGRPGRRLADAVYVGQITDVARGEAFTATNEPVEDWDAEVYGYKTVIVQLAARPLNGACDSELITASMKVPGSSTIDEWRGGLASYNPVVAFVTAGSHSDSAEFTLASNGHTLLHVGAQGALLVPFANAYRADWLHSTPTLVALRHEGERTTVTRPAGGPCLGL